MVTQILVAILRGLYKHGGYTSQINDIENFILIRKHYLPIFRSFDKVYIEGVYMRKLIAILEGLYTRG